MKIDLNDCIVSIVAYTSKFNSCRGLRAESINFQNSSPKGRWRNHTKTKVNIVMPLF